MKNLPYGPILWGVFLGFFLGRPFWQNVGLAHLPQENPGSAPVLQINEASHFLTLVEGVYVMT